MSEAAPDLSMIRGDWKFHIDYLTNALNRTLIRQQKLFGELDAGVRSADVDEAVQRQQKLWADIVAGSDSKGTIPTGEPILQEFIDACRADREVSNAVLDKSDSLTVEEFSEACRQVRALCDDLEMMREQRPDS